MLTAVFALSFAAPAPPALLDADVATTCAVISSIETANKRSFECCDSCALGMLRATKWVTVENTKWQVESLHEALDSAVYNTESNEKDDAIPTGSGDLAAVVAVKSESETSVEKTAVVHSVTKPCGVCISYDDCLSSGGHVNTWHRTCSLLMT